MTQRYREPEPEHKDPVHPVWRGIGCLLIILVPIISFAIATVLYDEKIPQKYFPLTSDLAFQVNIPGFGWLPLPYILVVTATISFLGFILLTVVYAMIFRVSSGSRYGPLDADPREFKKRKVKKSR
ncbi:MAG: hypothetical protein HUU38_09080 [Anaerolineales bacterium]|jgi:hypothetical protein|nr:hypothetical protein [Anaerolineales bacterium]